MLNEGIVVPSVLVLEGPQLNFGSFYESDCQGQYSPALIAAAFYLWQSALNVRWTSSAVVCAFRMYAFLA